MNTVLTEDQKVANILLTHLTKIFYRPYNVTFNRISKRISFGIPSNQVTFQNLTQLSQLLGTDEIDFSGQKEEVRYSSWTVDMEASAEIEVYNVDLTLIGLLLPAESK